MRLVYAWSFRCSVLILAGVLAVMVGCGTPAEKEKTSVRGRRCRGNLDAATGRAWQLIQQPGAARRRRCPFQRHRFPRTAQSPDCYYAGNARYASR